MAVCTATGNNGNNAIESIRLLVVIPLDNRLASIFTPLPKTNTYVRATQAGRHDRHEAPAVQGRAVHAAAQLRDRGDI